MGVLPILAVFPAALGVLFAFAGWDTLASGLGLTGGVLALAGFFRPGEDDEHRSAGRQLAVFALCLGMIPLLKPTLVSFRQQVAEKRRAEQTAAGYRNFESAAPSFGAELDDFAQVFFRYPTISEPGFPPFVDVDGQRRDLRPAAFPQPPNDPFEAPGRSLTTRGAGAVGVLIVSVGQDGVMETPTTQDMAIIDAEPCHPMAPFVWMGADLRAIEYDPADGPLGLGDLYYWQSAEGRSRGDDWAEVNAAWDLVAQEAGRGATPSGYAEAAEQLLEDGDLLAVLAAASRAAVRRGSDPQPREALVRAQITRAEALYRLGHFRRAADAALARLAEAPTDAEAHWWAGASLLRGGRPADASPHLAAAFQSTGDHPWREDAARAWEALAGGRTPELPDADGAPTPVEAPAFEGL